MSDKEISANAYLGETYRRIFGSGEENKPSRQQIVEPQMITVETGGIEAACKAAFYQGLRVAVEAVSILGLDGASGLQASLIDREKAIAAIRALEVKP
jgi:hypothetical protein